MLVHTGVDLVEIERIRRAVERYGEHFLMRIYTREERQQVAGNIASLAARFAAKEAVSKALGTGIGIVSWQEIEIIRSESGAPSVRLHGNAQAIAQKNGFTGWSVSISHSRTHAVAFFVCIASG